MPQTPLIRIGTELPVGRVIDIKRDEVIVKTTWAGTQPFSFNQIERFINELRSLQQEK